MKKFSSLLLTVVLLVTMLLMLTVPANAALKRIQKELVDFNTDPKTISQDYDIEVLDVPESTTLTITKGSTVIVRNKIDLKGKVVVNGTLDISRCTEKNGVDKITVGETGNLITEDSSGATLSQGNLAIITAAAGVAVGFLTAMFIFKKKQPAFAGGSENKDEE